VSLVTYIRGVIGCNELKNKRNATNAQIWGK